MYRNIKFFSTPDELKKYLLGAPEGNANASGPHDYPDRGGGDDAKSAANAEAINDIESKRERDIAKINERVDKANETNKKALENPNLTDKKRATIEGYIAGWEKSREKNIADINEKAERDISQIGTEAVVGEVGKTPQATSTTEAQDIAKSMGVDADYGSASTEEANMTNTIVGDTFAVFPATKKYLTKVDGNVSVTGGGRAGPKRQALGTYFAREGRIAIKSSWNQENANNNVESKFHPPGCNTKKSVMDHEMGHALDHTYKLGDNKEMKQLHKQIRGNSFSKGTPGEPGYKPGQNGYSKTREELSTYATENIGEFISEGWAEFNNSPNPRPVAKAIGEIILKHKGR